MTHTAQGPSGRPPAGTGSEPRTEPAVAAERKLRDAGAGDAAVATFLDQLSRVRAGEQGVLAEADLTPVPSLPDVEARPPVAAEAVADLLGQAVVIKLNGGLGTGMGLAGPKSLLPVKNGLTFLDVIARQMLGLRADTGARLPLVLMNSFATQAESLAVLDRYPGLAQDVPRDFLQNKVPKLVADTLEPVSHPVDPGLEWAPPGHGDLYPALITSGMLDALLAAGYRFAFVSNSDNLGATLDPRLLQWFAESGAPFALEAADRTPADRKGGHLALAADGSLLLRELAQVQSSDLEAFSDIERHRYFNTNNLWIDLPALAETLRARSGVLELPLIVNRKTVDPKDAQSTPVLQLETAMGAAIALWPDAQAIRVPRTRFGPVKTTNDLLAVRSDAYVLGADSAIALDPSRAGRPPFIDLDGRHFKLVGDFERHFPRGVPSLVGCQSLTVRGNVHFGADVVITGEVRLAHPAGDDSDAATDGEPLRIPDGAVLGR